MQAKHVSRNELGVQAMQLSPGELVVPEDTFVHAGEVVF
jgi:hypothetical protein